MCFFVFGAFDQLMSDSLLYFSVEVVGFFKHILCLLVLFVLVTS